MKLLNTFNLCFILLVLAIFSVKGLAQENSIKVPIDAWPPFRIISENNKYSGIDFDFLSLLSKELDIEINYKRYPWSRSLANMKAGTVDLISGVAKTKEREEYIYYSKKPYYKCSTVFYVLNEAGNSIKSYSDLKNYQIGYVTNSAYFKKFDEDKTLNKKVVSSELELVRMLAFNRVDVIIGTDCQADYDISRLGFNHIISKAEYKPGNEVNLYIGISKKSSLIKQVDKIDKAIEKLLEDKKVEEISKKYFQ